MITPPAELFEYVLMVLGDCPVMFEYDLVVMPSTDMDMKENPTVKDASWVGIVIYENDIIYRPESERVDIGLTLKNARNIVRNAGFRCEFLPLPGQRKDHNLDGGVPIVGTKTSMDNKQ